MVSERLPKAAEDVEEWGELDSRPYPNDGAHGAIELAKKFL
jgi:hypothetical protein